MANGSNIAFLQDHPVEVVVELGRTTRTLRQLAELDHDDVIDLDQSAEQLLDIVVGGRVLARGEVVMKGDRMSLRIVEVMGAVPRLSRAG